MKKFILKCIALLAVFFMTQGCSVMSSYIPTAHLGDGQVGVGLGKEVEINLYKLGDGNGIFLQAKVGGETSLKLGSKKLEAWDFNGKEKPRFEFTFIKITDEGEIHAGYLGWREVFETSMAKYEMSASQISLASLKLYSSEGIKDMALVKTTFGGGEPPVTNPTAEELKNTGKKKLSEVNTSLKETFGDNNMIMGAVWGSIAAPMSFCILAVLIQMLFFWLPSKARQEIYWFLVVKSRWMAYLIAFVFVISYLSEDSQVWIMLDKMINGGNYSTINLYLSEERQSNVLQWGKWLLSFTLSWTVWCYLFEKIRTFGKNKIVPIIEDAKKRKSEKKAKKGEQSIDASTSEVMLKMVECNKEMVAAFQERFLELCKLVTNQKAESDKAKVDALVALINDLKGEKKPVQEFFEHLEAHTKLQGENLKNLVQLLKDVGVVQTVEKNDVK